MKIEADEILQTIDHSISGAEKLKGDNKTEVGAAYLDGYILGMNHIKDLVTIRNEGEKLLERIKKEREAKYGN